MSFTKRLNFDDDSVGPQGSSKYYDMILEAHRM